MVDGTNVALRSFWERLMRKHRAYRALLLMPQELKSPRMEYRLCQCQSLPGRHTLVYILCT